MIRQSAADEVGPSVNGVEVLARGPVHEAFAEPLNLNGIDPLVVSATPPQPVEELPPEMMPEGNNVQWIPGYWAWEVDREDFIWISGVWRDCPPGQTWVPGNWTQNDSGWCWSAGLWVSELVEEVEYLPQPPESLEEGPTVQPLTENDIWVPGVWRYVDNRYAWRPGYWTGAQPDWLWTPAHYVWSPGGYVFVDGFWDYPLERRGVLFAPVYYQQPAYLQANYYYTPSAVISTHLLAAHLFARPLYGQYYFGDYYAPRYREIGIEPWLMVPRTRGCYDPLFSYYDRSYRREGRDWNRTVRDRYDFFDRHGDYRPAHTLAGLRQQRFAPIRNGDTSIQNIVSQQNNLVLNVSQVVQNEQRNVQAGSDRLRGPRLSKLSEDDRRVFADQAKAYRGFQERRAETEKSLRGRASNRDDDSDRRMARALSVTDLRNSTTSQRGREQRRRIAAELPPTPDRDGRQTGRPGGVPNDNNARSAPEATPGVGQDARREPLNDSSRERSGRSPRPGIGSATNATNSQADPASDLVNDRADRRGRPAPNAENDPIRTGQSSQSGPRLESPNQIPNTGKLGSQTDRLPQPASETSRFNRLDGPGNSRTGSPPGRNDPNNPASAGDRADRRRTSNYPPTEFGNAGAPNSAPAAADRFSPQENASRRAREVRSPISDPDPSNRNGQRDPAYPGSRATSPGPSRRGSPTAIENGASRAAQGLESGSRVREGTQRSTSRAVGQPPLPSSGRRSVQGPGQTAPSQLNNDTSNRSARGHVNRETESIPKNDLGGRALTSPPSARSTRDSARTTAPKRESSQERDVQRRSDNRSQSNSRGGDSDNSEKPRDNERKKK